MESVDYTTQPDDGVDYTKPPESPEEWLAKVDAAIDAVPQPETTYTPTLPGVEIPAVDQSKDVAVREAEAMPDDLRSVLRDSLSELLPLAVRLVKLSIDGKYAHLNAALDALGFSPIVYPGDNYTVADKDGRSRGVQVRDGSYYVPEDRQRMHDALAEAI